MLSSVKMNATYKCRQEFLHHFNYSKITTTTKKEKKTIIVPFQIQNTNTITKKWKGWKNRKFFCPFNYNINRITLKKGRGEKIHNIWMALKLLKSFFWEVYCNPKHDTKTLRKTNTYVNNVDLQRYTNIKNDQLSPHIYTWVFFIFF